MKRAKKFIISINSLAQKWIIFLKMEKGNFGTSQKGHRKLELKNYINNQHRKQPDGHILWQCERKDLRCFVSIITDSDGRIIRGLLKSHSHQADKKRPKTLQVREHIRTIAIKNVETGPSKIINETVSPDVAT